MKSVSRVILLLAAAAFLTALTSSCDRPETSRTGFSPVATDTMRMAALRQAAIQGGLRRAAALEIPTDPERVAVGRLIFESRAMSINGEISCRDCHLDKFGSADGLPNAIGVGGEGEGRERMESDGRILPRNALPFWGRGGKGFDTFFWDGKVQKKDDVVASQYGEHSPSDDPLVVAVHLPSVELREMVEDTIEIRETVVSEDVGAANTIQSELAKRFASDTDIGPLLGSAYDRDASKISFAEIADALAQFIRHEFRLRPTRLERFVFDRGPITEAELAGGVLFYGRGRCVSCHNGPYFSDLDFHAVAFPQAGFGKNGFGIDEGRYNVTLDPRDRFLFRTAPLHNVTQTAPYSHSGSITSLKDAIIAHFDPLRLVDTNSMDVRQRSDLYARLGPAALEPLPTALRDEEVDQLVAFLAMLEFSSDGN
ncbi:His-Xaa-Ser system-associated MauG-like protein [Erythrobacter sp. THAF29]|uniref:His-Xaa-Ser system-associated MauG-like protein n=1 Tax=Erythrobacter sp. THAF29 TaxID=2587851 RepID=UPI0012A998B7|nr:His-Xaa-Ser system-associated MauG-like protein [Erythrobacter sp. THAF29]QFT75996.1 Cytochrome c551 peroxidase precursor [Erythrobacter sp. THAF29]